MKVYLSCLKNKRNSMTITSKKLMIKYSSKSLYQAITDCLKKV